MELCSVAKECTRHVVQIVHPRGILWCPNVGAKNVHRVELCEPSAVMNPFDDCEEGSEAMVLTATQRAIGVRTLATVTRAP